MTTGRINQVATSSREVASRSSGNADLQLDVR